VKLILIEKRIETKEVKTFVFKPEEKFGWIAGQYLIYSLPHQNQDLRGKMRFFTISQSPFENNPSITTKIIKKSSSFKKALDNLKIGQSMEAKGPDGDFVVENLNRKYIFIAGEMGITPFRSILKELKFENKNLDIILLYSTKDKDILFKNTFDNLKLNNLKIEYFIGKRIYKNAIEKIADFKKRIFYVSGPDAMVEEMEKLLLELGVKKENIKSDYFSGYKDI
jgi:ferredoxin-NADP reductase